MRYEVETVLVSKLSAKVYLKNAARPNYYFAI